MILKNKIKYYDIAQATRICGYDSPSMIDYLCRNGLISSVPQPIMGRGRKRLFSFKDLLVLKVYRQLLDAGVSVSKLKKAFKDSKEFQSIRATPGKLQNNQGEANILFTDGVDVFVRAQRADFIQAGTRGQFVFSFMISLELLHQEISSNVNKEEDLLAKKQRKVRYRSTSRYRQAL